MKELFLSGQLMDLDVHRAAIILRAKRRERTKGTASGVWGPFYFIDDLQIRQMGDGWLLGCHERERLYKTWSRAQNAIRRWMKDAEKFVRMTRRSWATDYQAVEESDQ